jgi:hypothetical protein
MVSVCPVKEDLAEELNTARFFWRFQRSSAFFPVAIVPPRLLITKIFSAIPVNSALLAGLAEIFSANSS